MEGKVKPTDIERAVPFVRRDADPNSSRMSPAEAFLFTRIDGSTNVQTLSQLVGLAVDETIVLLRSLVGKGLVSCPGMDGEGEEQDIDQEALKEDVELDIDMKKKVLKLHAGIDGMNHYQLLGVPRNADSKQIKQAYFQLSKLYHPDSYFRKRLGSYKQRIEEIFKRLTKAYETLSNQQKRQAYDSTLPPEPTLEKIEEKIQQKIRQRDTARLRREKLERMLRSNPLVKRKAQAARHVEAARKAEQEGDIIGAANFAKLALALLPDDEQIRQLHDKLEQKAAPERAQKAFKRGLGDESIGRLEEAYDWFTKAVESDPDHTRALYKAAELALELKRDLRKGAQYCRRLLELEPMEHKARLILAKIYMEQGMLKNAIRELGQYVNANPLDEKSAQLLKELKKRVS